MRPAEATGSCRRPGPRRSRSRSRSCPGASSTPSETGSTCATGERARRRSRRPPSSGAVLEAAEEVRLLEDHAGGVLRGVARAPPGRSTPPVVRHLDDLEPEARARRSSRPGAPAGSVASASDDLRAARSRASRRSRRRRRRSSRRSRRRSRRPSRSARRSRSGTRRSPAARPGSSPAGTACTRSGTRRAAAPRRRPPGRSGRRCRRRGTRAPVVVSTFLAASSSRCATSSGSESAGSRSSCPVEADARRDVAEELLDRVDADRGEHLLAVGVGQRRGGPLLLRRARSCVYAVDVEQRCRPRDGSVSRIRTSQPSPYGSSFTVSGASTTFWFTSSTSPESGAITSETALTDSTSPYVASFAIELPSAGRLVVDELAERVLREPRDPERRLVALDPRPVVLGVVPQLVGVALGLRPHYVSSRL